MSKLNKIKSILKIATPIAGALVPGVVNIYPPLSCNSKSGRSSAKLSVSILDAVNKSINDDSDPQNVAGLQALAHRVDELEQAVLMLAERK